MRWSIVKPKALADSAFSRPTRAQAPCAISPISLASNCSDHPLLLELDVQPQPADFVAQHVETDRRAGLQGVVALDHRLVDLGAALDVVALDGQQFLQQVAGAV